MKKFLLFAGFFFLLKIAVIAQTVLGKINLEDGLQSHILTKKTGEKYVGKIISMTKQTIIFRPEGLQDSAEFDLKRNQIAKIEVINYSDENGGELRQPFLNISKKFPKMELDLKLDVNNYSQRVRVVFSGEPHEGKIHGIRQNGVELSKSSRVVFFPFKKISKMEVIERGLTGIVSKPIEFQVDTFPGVENSPVLEKVQPIKFDTGFDWKKKEQKHLLVTRRGDEIMGKIDTLTTDMIRIRMDNGSQLQFAQKDVEKVEIRKDGYFRKEKRNKVLFKRRKSFPDGNYILAQNRLLISPTGFGLKKGETEYRGIQGFINGFDYGVNDHATIGLGFYPLIGANMLTGRFNLSTDIGKFIHFSGGADFLYNLGGAATDSGGGLYTWHLAGSVGTPTAFVNISYNNWKTFDEYEKGTVIGAGFSFKTGKSFRIFSDVLFTKEEEKSEFSNNVYRYSETIISVGSSWFNRVNKVDFGLTVIPGLDGFIWSDFVLFPCGSYVRRF